MKLPSLLLLLLVPACGKSDHAATPAPSDAAPVESVTIHDATPKPGTSRKRTKKTVTEVPAGGATLHEERSVEKTVSFIAPTGGAAAMEQVAYGAITDTMTMSNGTPGNAATRDSRITGKAYVISTSATGEETVTAPDGSRVDDKEAAEVAGEEAGAPLGQFLDGQRYLKDRPTKLAPARALAYLGAGAKGGSLTLTYRGMDGALAKFDEELVLSGGDIGFTLTGTIEIDPKTGIVASSSLSGPTSAPGQGPGTMTITETDAAAS